MACAPTDSETSTVPEEILKPLHTKLDNILVLLQRWEEREETKVEKNGTASLAEPTSLRPLHPSAQGPSSMEASRDADEGRTSHLLAPALQSCQEDSAELVEEQHKRLSAGDLLLAPRRRRSHHTPLASCDAATWTEQVRNRYHFDAAASMRMTSEFERSRSHVPSLNDMNDAFVQAVMLGSTAFKPEKQTRFAQVEEVDDHEDAYDKEMMRLSAPSGSHSIDLVNSLATKPTQVVPATVTTSAPPAPSPKDKAATLEHLSHKSQVLILGNANSAGSLEDEVVKERDVGSQIFLSRLARMFWLVGLVAILNGSGELALQVAVHSSFRWGHPVTEMIYGIASMTSVIYIRKALRSDDLNLAIEKLQSFVSDFMVQWSKVSTLEKRISVAVWLLMVCCFGLGVAIDDSHHGLLAEHPFKLVEVVMNVLAVLVFCISSLLVVLVAYVQSHILLGLDRSMDCWCCSILNDSNFSLGVESWNCLQALLKCIGRGIASSFLALQVCGAVGLIYVLASALARALQIFQQGLKPDGLLLEGVNALPLLVFLAINMRVCANGAALTEKCRNIPAFVNQIPTQDPLDEDRLYLVQYVTASSAGFFVKDAKLTREMFLKNFVALGGLMTGLVGVMSRIYSS